MERKRAISGGFLSVMWLAVWAVAYCVAPPNKPLQFNEWGDFLSGIVAPLAFLWLILGYMQQGEELRLNTTALKSQQRELERTAVETADLAAATRRLATATQNQVEQAELEARPLLEFAHRSAGTRHIKAYLHNHGGTARNLRVGGTPMGVVVTVPPTARADPPPPEQIPQLLRVQVGDEVEMPVQFDLYGRSVTGEEFEIRIRFAGGDDLRVVRH